MKEAKSWSEFLSIEESRISEIIDTAINFFKERTGSIVSEFDLYFNMLLLARTDQEKVLIFFLIGTIHDQVQEAKQITQAMGAFHDFAKTLSDIAQPGEWDKNFPEALKKQLGK